MQRRSQMDIALDHMKTKYGLRAGAPAHSTTKSPTSEKKRRHLGEFAGHKPQDEQRYMRPINTQRVAAPPATSTHSPVKKKSRLKDEVRSKPAVRPENQKLVDELFQLGEYELSTGRSQRGVTRLRAAKQVRDASDVITSGEQARKLEGIGVSAAEKVDIMLRDGIKGAMKEYEDDDDAVEEEEEEGGGELGEDSGEDVAKATEQLGKKNEQGSRATTQKSTKSHATQSADDEGEEEEEEEGGEEEQGKDEDYGDEDDDDDEDYFASTTKAKK